MKSSKLSVVCSIDNPNVAILISGGYDVVTCLQAFDVASSNINFCRSLSRIVTVPSQQLRCIAIGSSDVVFGYVDTGRVLALKDDREF
jgi:hypothetical protein